MCEGALAKEEHGVGGVFDRACPAERYILGPPVGVDRAPCRAASSAVACAGPVSPAPAFAVVRRGGSFGSAEMDNYVGDRRG
ncbi:hypothetical protein GCM10010390_90990 [Streptomyces mordarskii]|uniref:Uncharacterized protein n=1 Tax=Streptomyces mordarskii TaxID=1226758 RepID=A0ABN1EU01_9ACTN